MSKPYGLTSTFEVVTPNHVQNAIWDAVREAIDANMTVDQFRQEAAECWDQKRRDDMKSDASDWNKK